MGNCIGICNTNILKLKGDVVLEKNSDGETGKYLETQYIKKVIYLQKSVKQYLRKKQSSKNEKNKNGKIKNSPKTKPKKNPEKEKQTKK